MKPVLLEIVSPVALAEIVSLALFVGAFAVWFAILRTAA